MGHREPDAARDIAHDAAREPASADAGRRFRDAAGVNWHVREREAAGRPSALYFETEMAFRRVTHYPLDWRDLSTAELETLSRAT